MSEEITISIVEEINKEHELFQQTLRAGYYHALRAGELLVKVKESLKHGDFIDWTFENCTFTVRTAQNYMRLFNNRELIEQEKAKYISLLSKAKDEEFANNGQLIEKEKREAEFLSIEEALSIIRMAEAEKQVKKDKEARVKEFQEQYDKQVRDYLFSASSFLKEIAEAREALEFGKFSPEAKRFTLRKNRKVIEALEEFSALLERVAEK